MIRSVTGGWAIISCAPNYKTLGDIDESNAPIIAGPFYRFEDANIALGTLERVL